MCNSAFAQEIKTENKEQKFDVSFSQIFGALRPEVETIQGFRNSLLQNNGNNQQHAVNNLFEAYFYN